MWKEFKDFILRGNVFDLAVGIIIGIAFGQVVTSLVNDVIMPPIGLLLGKVDFKNLFIVLSNPGGGVLANMDDVVKAKAVTINYGLFINTIINFIIIALVVFLLIRVVNKLKKPAPVAAVNTKDCPYCYTAIPIKATRCPNCTSELRV